MFLKQEQSPTPSFPGHSHRLFQRQQEKTSRWRAGSQFRVPNGISSRGKRCWGLGCPALQGLAQTPSNPTLLDGGSQTGGGKLITSQPPSV